MQYCRQILEYTRDTVVECAQLIFQVSVPCCLNCCRMYQLRTGSSVPGTCTVFGLLPVPSGLPCWRRPLSRSRPFWLSLRGKGCRCWLPTLSSCVLSGFASGSCIRATGVGNSSKHGGGGMERNIVGARFHRTSSSSVSSYTSI